MGVPVGRGRFAGSCAAAAFVQLVAVPWLDLMAFVAVSAVASLLAAILPALLAGRMNILDAIAHEQRPKIMTVVPPAYGTHEIHKISPEEQQYPRRYLSIHWRSTSSFRYAHLCDAHGWIGKPGRAEGYGETIEGIKEFDDI